MPNVLLTKHTGGLASVPAGSITAILSMALDAKTPEHATAQSVITTSYRGGATAFYLIDNGRDVFRAVEDAVEGRKALRMSRKGTLPVVLAVGEDQSYFQEGALLSWEEVGDEDDRRYRVAYRRFDGQIFDIDVNHSPENRATLDKATETKET